MADKILDVRDQVPSRFPLSHSAETTTGLEQEKETSTPSLATHIAWTIAELSKDLERFQRITDWPRTEISIHLNGVCDKTVQHLAFMRQQGPSTLLLNYPWRETSAVLVHLQKVHDQRSYIRVGLAELEAKYRPGEPRSRRIVSRLATVLLVHASLGGASRVLVEALTILDDLINKQNPRLAFPEVQFSRLDPADWVTMKDEYKICCDGASLILNNLQYINKDLLRDDIEKAFQLMIRWGRLLFPDREPGLDELFDLDNKSTKGTRELFHRVFSLIIIS